MRQSNTRILFTEKGKPIGGLHVRADGNDEERKTDGDGQVEVSLSEGRQPIEIRRGDEWTTQFIEVTREASLIIVDLDKPNGAKNGRQPEPETSFLDIGKLNLGDRYVYDEVLGRGGMSVVLKARDRLLNRSVAIKLLSQELASQPEAQNIFLTEARSLATLSHPNLVAVHDICKVDEQVFIVIEHVEGESLETLIGAVSGFNETVALQTIIQLARVVAYLHDHGLVHRDLKPANAMIRNDGTLKLIDFGLARHFDDLNIRGTRVRGTPAYMSPEQIRGAALTPASDVYQLGVCLFEVLTGRLPFHKGDVGYKHVHEKPPRVDKLNPEISELLSDLVASCLQKQPERRPKDGQELLRQLQAIYQNTGATGGNLLEELRRDIGEKGGITRDGYSVSEMRLMEGAGKHLRTSDFAAQAISEILSDPNLGSQVVINHNQTRWLPTILGASLGAGITSAVLLLLVLGPHPLAMRSADAPDEPAIVETTTEPAVVAIEDEARTEKSPQKHVESTEERARLAAERLADVARSFTTEREFAAVEVLEPEYGVEPRRPTPDHVATPASEDSESESEPDEAKEADARDEPASEDSEPDDPPEDPPRQRRPSGFILP